MPVNDRDRERIRRQAQRDMGTTPEQETDGRISPTPDQNREFDHQPAVYFGNCPVCRGRVALHCSSCKVQVTGCNCTLTDRVISIAEQKRERGQLWIPD